MNFLDGKVRQVGGADNRALLDVLQITNLMHSSFIL